MKMSEEFKKILKHNKYEISFKIQFVIPADTESLFKK